MKSGHSQLSFFSPRKWSGNSRGNGQNENCYRSYDWNYDYCLLHNWHGGADGIRGGSRRARRPYLKKDNVVFVWRWNNFSLCKSSTCLPRNIDTVPSRKYTLTWAWQTRFSSGKIIVDTEPAGHFLAWLLVTLKHKIRYSLMTVIKFIESI